MAREYQPAEGFDDGSAEPGVWRYVQASRVRVIVDGKDYFELMQQAMLKARQRILLIGWDVDTRIHLTQGRRWWQKGRRRQYPARLGSFILWLARHRKGLEIRILKWSFGAVKFLARGSMLLDLIRWFPHKRIDFKFDTSHPIGCSHHQKIVVVDDKLAVCGGIDMTGRRWDTREHLPQDNRRRGPGGFLYGPWHDMTMMMEGEVASALDALGRDRWIRAGGTDLSPARVGEGSAWPDDLEPQFENVELGISRTRAEYDWQPAVNEIEQLFLLQIARARHFIYAENQYFASRKIAEAISRKLTEDDPPEVVIINPRTADGWIEEQAMDTARTQLVRAINELDTKNRFHIYAPYAGDTPIYVHAKLLIVDDQILRIGSANFNNRSLGLDSECDCFIDCSRPANGHCGEAIRALRYSLLAEHCGLDEGEVGPLLEQTGSMAAMIASVPKGKPRELRPLELRELTEIERELAQRQMLDPEKPSELFEITPAKRGLFRPGSLLARGRQRWERRRRRKI